MSHSMPPHEFFGWRVAEAYCYHLIKQNKKLIYRHMFGDIQLNQHFIFGLLDGRLNEKFSRKGQAAFYFKLLKSSDREIDRNVIFVGGEPPKLNNRGIRYMNAFLHEFGMMLIDIGVKHADGSISLPEDYHA